MPSFATDRVFNIIIIETSLALVYYLKTILWKPCRKGEIASSSETTRIAIENDGTATST